MNKRGIIGIVALIVVGLLVVGGATTYVVTRNSEKKSSEGVSTASEKGLESSESESLKKLQPTLDRFKDVFIAIEMENFNYEVVKEDEKGNLVEISVHYTTSSSDAEEENLDETLIFVYDKDSEKFVKVIPGNDQLIQKELTFEEFLEVVKGMEDFIESINSLTSGPDLSNPSSEDSYPENEKTPETAKKVNNLQEDGCGEGTVLDKRTNLCWEKNTLSYVEDSGLKEIYGNNLDLGIHFRFAKEYCSNLSLAGKKWRLSYPTELKDLIGENGGADYLSENSPFIGLKIAKYYWVDDPEVDDKEDTSIVWFSREGYISKTISMDYCRFICVSEN
jgi:hypothetical protein